MSSQSLGSVAFAIVWIASVLTRNASGISLRASASAPDVTNTAHGFGNAALLQSGLRYRGNGHAHSKKQRQHASGIWLNTTEAFAAIHGSSTAYSILGPLVPTPAKCPCAIQEWDQYAMCQEAINHSQTAWSFGIRGYDLWGKFLGQTSGIVPRTFDCYDRKAPTDFENSFYPICLGPQEGAFGPNTFMTLPGLLNGSSDGSALVKLDIEGDEFPVLAELNSTDISAVSSLNVEYHLYYATGCPSKEELKLIKDVFTKMQQSFVVIGGRANYYGEDCFIEGVKLPKLVAVSYAARQMCNDLNAR